VENDQARGYMVLAMHEAGCSVEQIRKAMLALDFHFNDKTEEAAEEQGRALFYRLLDQERASVTVISSIT